MTVEERLEDFIMGALPPAPKPAGMYAPVTIAGSLAFVSGQIPVSDGKIRYIGKVCDSNISAAQESARLCAINVLAQLKSALGSLDRVTKIARITGFVNSDASFTAQPRVIDAASNVFAAAYGKASHARVAVGVASLPLGVMTEVDAIAEITA